MDPGGRILNLPSAERWETDLERMGGEEVNALCREVVAVAEATLCRGLQDFTSYSAHSLQTWFAEAAEVRRRHCAAFTHNHISISDVESSRLPHLECTSLATACGFGSCFSSWDASSPTKENSASLLDDRSDCTLARRLRIIAKEYKDGRFAWLVNIITDQMLPTLEGVLGKQYEGDVLQRILDVIQPYVGVLEGVLQLPISGAVLHSDSVATVQWLGLLKDAMKEERGYLGSGDIDAALDCTDRVHECLEQLNGVVNSKQISVRQLLVDYEAALGIVYPQLQLSLTATRDTKQNLRDMISAVQSDFASIAAAVIKFEEEDSAMTKQLAERKASAALQIQKIEDEIIALWGQMFQKRYDLSLDSLKVEYERCIAARGACVRTFVSCVEQLETTQGRHLQALSALSKQKVRLEGAGTQAEELVTTYCHVEKMLAALCHELQRFYEGSRAHHTELRQRACKEAFAYLRRQLFMHAFDDHRHTRIYEAQLQEEKTLSATKQVHTETFDPLVRGVSDAQRNVLQRMYLTTRRIAEARMKVEAVSNDLETLRIDLRCLGLGVEHPSSEVNTVLLAKWERSILLREELCHIRKGDTEQILEEELLKIQQCRTKWEETRGTTSSKLLLDNILRELG